MSALFISCVCLVAAGLAATVPAATTPPTDPGSRGVDWDRVRAKVATYDWAKAVVDDLRGEFERTRKRFAHPPLGRTGWWHDYYCSKDAHRLTFDPDKPTEHVCPACGTVYSGTPYDDCWRSQVHATICRAAQYAAILYRITGQNEYRNYARNVLLWYADHYSDFEVHGEHAGKGRIRSQSLDEATQLVTLAQAYWDICPALSDDDRRHILDDYFLPDARFIHAQTRTIHNIHSWHNAAVGLVGMLAGDAELVRQAIDGPAGLKQQIAKGVRDDGFWYEGSIGYHFYTISSLEPLYLAAKAQGLDLAGTDKFELMYRAPLRMAFPNGELPANNDGWPGTNLSGMTSYYETAAGLWPDSELPACLAALYGRRPRSSLDALLYGPDKLPKPKPLGTESTLFEDSGIAILRNGSANAYLKFGPYGGGHDHRDRLNLIVFAQGRVVIPDIGTSGYGIGLNHWFRSPAAHNLLVVDGAMQRPCSGKLLDYGPDRVSAEAGPAYPGVNITRTLRLHTDHLQDHIAARSDTPHTYDLFYHVRGTLIECDLDLQDAEPFDRGVGYDMLRNVRRATGVKVANLHFDLRDGPGSIALNLQSETPFEVYTGTCPDNPADKQMAFVMLRIQATAAVWDHRIAWTADPESRGRDR